MKFIRFVSLVLITGALFLFAGRAHAQVGPAQQDVTKRTLELFVGEQKILSADGVKEWSVATKGVIELRPPQQRGADFVMVALQPGETTVLFIMLTGEQVSYTVTVRQVRITEKDNIRLDFYFVELTRDSGYRAGIGWPGAIAAQGSVDLQWNLNPTALTSATASVASQVLPRLDLAQDSGWAKVMREATVVVANGGASTFESGGELNFRVESGLAVSIQTIQFGSRIEVQPFYDRTTGRLDLKVKALVSELTDASVDGIPGRAYTNLDTVVNLELGQSIVLAGIHAKSAGRSSDGLPVLSQIPVLGYLFGSQAQREAENENVVFIVPTVVQAVTSVKRERVKAAQKAFERYSGHVNGKMLYRRAFPEMSPPTPEVEK